MNDESKVWRGWAVNVSGNPIQPPNLYLKKSSATGAASINNTICYEVILLPAADYDALIAERDALRASLLNQTECSKQAMEVLRKELCATSDRFVAVCKQRDALRKELADVTRG